MKIKLTKFFTISLIAFSLLGCQIIQKPSTDDNQSSDNNEQSSTDDKITCSLCENMPTAEKAIFEELGQYTPTTFDVNSVTSTTIEINDGIVQKTYLFNKKNGHISKVVVTEVDLSKASIAAGTTNNSVSNITKSTPIQQALAYENANEGVKVMAAVNADFFGGTSTVNAFAKDSVIIKDSHNDKGIYDYKNLDADIPASMPMLFGISGMTAQVAPIIQNATVKETIQAKLFYELSFTNKEKNTTLKKGITFNNADGSDTLINVLTNDDCIGTALPGSKVLTIQKHLTDSTRLHGEIKSITEVQGSSIYRSNEDNFYVIVPADSEFNDYQIGDLVSYNITSPDDTWKYYDTIIGCRQALVINGEIASTVTKENSNGAQGTNIPRTAIGVMPNGNVAIFSIEALRYGKYGSSSDTTGLSLPELADFMRYYGVYSGANFDGGGSTQLISKNPSTNEFEVIVRSSDYGTYELENARPVINTLLVYIKE